MVRFLINTDGHKVNTRWCFPACRRLLPSAKNPNGGQGHLQSVSHLHCKELFALYTSYFTSILLVSLFLWSLLGMARSGQLHSDWPLAITRAKAASPQEMALLKLTRQITYVPAMKQNDIIEVFKIVSFLLFSD